MANTRRNFTRGAMSKDIGVRLLQDGMFRHALNVLVIHSEGSQVGSVQTSLSNKKLTSLSLGSNVNTIGVYSDEFQDKLYWFVKSDLGCYLIEWDNNLQTATVVLADTRPEETRVLRLLDTHLITGIEKIISENTDNDLLLFTDDNIEPCCINIERAKTWGVNGFTEEDIYLIKKPPRYAPSITPTRTSERTNNMEEKFLSFSYRYKYLDGEYSALSDFSNYSFTAKNFDLDYYNLDNLGMVNSFNGVAINFQTGGKQVTDIQLCAKESNSNRIYIIESFNKKKEGWDLLVSQSKGYTFSNSKLYATLPSKELSRAFDNVPLKAKSLSIIGNRAVFGNYLEGRDLVDLKESGEGVSVDYGISLISEPIDTGVEFTTVASYSVLNVTNPNSIQLKKGNKIIFYLNLYIDTSTPSYDNDFSYIVPEDFASSSLLFNSLDFSTFVESINSDFISNYSFSKLNLEGNSGWQVKTDPRIAYSTDNGFLSFSISSVTFEDTNNANFNHVFPFSFLTNSSISVTETANSTSIKTNREVEVGVQYLDKYNRATTVLTTAYNTLYVPQEFSTFKNRIKVELTNKPPYWADRIKFVFKSQPLAYQTIYVTRFYNDGFYVWCKLEAENKDKVSIGDVLVVKLAGDVIVTNPVKVKVLDIQNQEKNFLLNLDIDGNEIEEEEGLYMKIRPDKFQMNFDNYEIKQSESSSQGGRDRYPHSYLDLFDTINSETSEVTPLAIPAGSSIYLYFSSWRYYDSGKVTNTYEFTHYAQIEYSSLEEWFKAIIIDKPLFGNVDEDGQEKQDYSPKLSIRRGSVFKYSEGGNAIAFIDDADDNVASKLYLEVEGTWAGGTRDRSGYLQTKMVVRTNTGFYAFETEPKQAENDIFYPTEQTFEISNGNHVGNIQSQDTSNSTPAIFDLDFFNCYTQGNGIESYRVKDSFNKNSLNIDLRPTATSIEEYKAIRRYADLTYGESFIESVGINGLNEFNLSTANYKELDKQYGSIQKLYSKDNDILVLQEVKASKVLFGKDILYNGDGTSNITSIPEVLGQQVMYLGENGIGKNPESFAVNDYQVFYINPKRGVVLRLSVDGVTPIVEGMVDWFRDLSITDPNSNKIGCFDPYFNQYVLATRDYTLSYSDQVKGWTSFHSYKPDFMTKLNNRFFSVKDGQLYLHNDRTNPVRNNFYGQQFSSEIITVINDSSEDDKIFKTLAIEGTHPWDVSIKTNLSKSEIYKSEFNKRESRFFAHIRKNEDLTDYHGNKAQGIGAIKSINGLVFSFGVIPSLVSIGDNLELVRNGSAFNVGVITNVNKKGNTITVNFLGSNPIVGEYCLAIKNSRVEGSEIRGYYAEITMTTNETQEVELFSISGNIIKSYV